MALYLRAKFEVSSITLTCFRQGGGGGVILPPPSPQNESLNSPPRLGLNANWSSKHGENQSNAKWRKNRDLTFSSVYISLIKSYYHVIGVYISSV